MKFTSLPDFLRRCKSSLFWKTHQYRTSKILSSVSKAKPVYGLQSPQRKPRIIISLTTYTPRFSTIGMTLKSLLLQTMKPDMIIVWLDGDVLDITEEMHSYEKYGITFRHTPENIYSHKKYFYAFQEYKDDIIITVDDDAVYPPDLVSSLMGTYGKYPSCICARRVHQITWDAQGNINPYMKWVRRDKSSREPSFKLCATGVEGVLYPPHLLHIDPSQKELFMKLCPRQDDLWLKWMEALQGIKVVWVPNHLMDSPVIEESQKVALRFENNQKSGNDQAIANLTAHFGKLTPTGIERR